MSYSLKLFIVYHIISSEDNIISSLVTQKGFSPNQKCLPGAPKAIAQFIYRVDCVARKVCSLEYVFHPHWEQH